MPLTTLFRAIYQQIKRTVIVVALEISVCQSLTSHRAEAGHRTIVLQFQAGFWDQSRWFERTSRRAQTPSFRSDAALLSNSRACL